MENVLYGTKILTVADHVMLSVSFGNPSTPNRDAHIGLWSERHVGYKIFKRLVAFQIQN